MLQIIGIVVVVLAVGAAVYYFGFYAKGKINDRDGDYIPDEVEDAVEDAKKVDKEVGNGSQFSTAVLKNYFKP